MPTKQPAFFAYPGRPAEVVQPIRAAIEAFNRVSQRFTLEAWEKNDISGIPLTDPIFSKISEAAFLCADVTYLNENVVFEVGYAIGSKKRCLLFVNGTLAGDRDLANAVGIFDTLGYETYETTAALAANLTDRTTFVSCCRFC